ncbi:hypothetical protein [Nannocystis sp.]|uniref:hypothetical protein n=1 Tax=Nannocystis sp. TaxID=1962667 RepID=UPI0025EA7762|nr:hypothetical protein [Nannocystis sp.]MBK7825915.1 hypothetical protein [Nannocystis sp.]
MAPPPTPPPNGHHGATTTGPTTELATSHGATTGLTRLGAAAPLAALATLVALAITVPGYRAHGLWSTGEISVLQRAQAALGAALGGLERAPILPDALRTQALALTGDPAAIRLPGALAAALLVGLAVLLARRLGAAPRFALLAGGFALAFPVLQSQARLALGNPIGELAATTAALLGAAALTSPRRSTALALALATLATLALALLSAGLLLGVLLPLLAIALAWPRRPSPPDLSQAPANLSQQPASTDLSKQPTDLSQAPANLSQQPADLSQAPALVQHPPRWLAALLAAAILGVVGLLLALAYHQGDGWIPALAAARDLPLAARPYYRDFAASLQELSNQLFPWLPLLVVGLLHPGRARWPALWLLAGLVLVSAWSLRYGPTPLPLIVPAALVCAAAVEHLLAPSTSTATRRLGLALALAGGLILAKDARRTPGSIGAVLVHTQSEHNYPAKELAAPDLLAQLAQLAALAVLLAVLTRRPVPPSGAQTRLQRLQARLPPWLPVALLLATLAHQALRYGHSLLPRTSELLSLHRPLTRYAAWRDAGALISPLAIHRISDPGVALYGPPAAGRSALASRDSILTWLKGQAPAAALVRRSELASLHEQARADGWPLYVLDASNRDIVLLANTLPPGAVDANPILRVLRDAPPELAHSTLVRFEDFVEVLGWQWHEPIVRGRETTLEVALHVLKPLIAGSKLYFRLQQGRLSRINPMPHELAEGLYPAQHWRAGDYILHRFTVAVPMLEVLPGAHEVVLGLRRSESSNYKISFPTTDDPELAVHFPGSNHEFAELGPVTVW